MRKKQSTLLISLTIFLLILVAYFSYTSDFGPNILRVLQPSNRLSNSNQSDYQVDPKSTYGVSGSDSMQTEQLNSKIAPANQVAPTNNTASQDRKIIKNANLNITVKNIDDVSRNLEQRASAIGGYLVESNISNNLNSQDFKTGYIRLRIPASNLSDFLVQTKTLAVKVISENINSSDVTSEFIDLQARLKNLQAAETQYQQLLSKTTKVTEILEVQRELTNTRSQIEQLQGQINYIEKSSELSEVYITLTLDSSELPITPENRWEPQNIFKSSLRSLVVLGQNLSYLAIFLVVYSVIWIPVTIGLFFLYKYLKRKIK